jgi:AcrR family transcriptional regulator
VPRIRAENIDAHKAKTRRDILDTASALFLSEGYTATSLGDIAVEIGVGRTTLYEYFRDKEEILVLLVEEEMPELVGGMIDSVPSNLTASERLGELVIRNLEFIADERNLGTLIMREVPKLSPEAQARVRAAHERLEDELQELCTEAVANGEFRNIDPVWAGRFVNAMMMGAARSLLRTDDPKQQVHDAADTVVQVLLHGLSASA